MVLTNPLGGGAGRGHAPTPIATPGGGIRAETGSQALEFAMVVPLLGLLLALLTHTGLLLADVVVAQGVAREVGRAAAVDGDERAREVAERLAGDREVHVDLDEHDGMIEARIELASGAFAAVGVDVRVPATATFRAEHPAPMGLDGG